MFRDLIDSKCLFTCEASVFGVGEGGAQGLRCRV